MYEFKRYEKNPVLTVGDLPGKAGFYLLAPAVWTGETGKRVVSEPVLLEVLPKRTE